ncbi:flavodoxin family protein [Desulfarculus baarsii]
MKVICLLASPRPRSNSSALALEFCRAAEERGADVRVFKLNEMDYQGCQGCYACKTKLDHCALQDDLTEVFDQLSDADALVLATPVYFWDICGQLKLFVDRTFSLYGPNFMTDPNDHRLSGRKSLLFVQSQEDVAENHGDIFKKYKVFFKMAGFGRVELLRLCQADEPGVAASRAAEMARARELAGELLA